MVSSWNIDLCVCVGKKNHVETYEEGEACEKGVSHYLYVEQLGTGRCEALHPLQANAHEYSHNLVDVPSRDSRYVLPEPSDNLGKARVPPRPCDSSTGAPA